MISMTAREIDMLREFLGREIKHVRDAGAPPAASQTFFYWIALK